MQEKKKDIKRELIEKGKKKGVLTFKDLRISMPTTK